MSRVRHFRTAPTLLSLATALIVAPAAVAATRDAFDAKSAVHFRDAYVADMDTVHVKLLALAKAIPADKYSVSPRNGDGRRRASADFINTNGMWRPQTFIEGSPHAIPLAGARS